MERQLGSQLGSHTPGGFSLRASILTSNLLFTISRVDPHPAPRGSALTQVGGPLMIKLGQWLSTRRDLLSVQACNALARLHTNVRLLAGNLLVNTKIQRAAQL